MSLNHIFMNNQYPQDVEVNDLKVDGEFTYKGVPQYHTPAVSITNYSTIPVGFFDIITGGSTTQNFNFKFGNLKRYRFAQPSEGQYCIFDATFEYQPSAGFIFARAQLNLSNSYLVDDVIHDATYKLLATVQTIAGAQTAVIQDAQTIYVEFIPNGNNQVYQVHFEWYSSVPYVY